MTCYLIHFDKPISSKHTAQHYLGWTNDLEERLKEHYNGNGSRLCKVAKERNISFRLVRIWEGDRQLERKLKRQKNGKKLCPICNRGKGND